MLNTITPVEVQLKEVTPDSERLQRPLLPMKMLFERWSGMFAVLW